jgi:hypothetical protein
VQAYTVGDWRFHATSWHGPRSPKICLYASSTTDWQVKKRDLLLAALSVVLGHPHADTVGALSDRWCVLEMQFSRLQSARRSQNAVGLGVRELVLDIFLPFCSGLYAGVDRYCETPPKTKITSGHSAFTVTMHTIASLRKLPGTLGYSENICKY